MIVGVDEDVVIDGEVDEGVVVVGVVGGLVFC